MRAVLVFSPEEALYEECSASDLILSVLVKSEGLADRDFFLELYRALCNVIWINPRARLQFSYSWRAAGDVVAGLRGAGEDYIDYYCGSNEGYVEPWIIEAFEKLGWYPREFPEDDSEADYIARAIYQPVSVKEAGGFLMGFFRGEIFHAKLENMTEECRFEVAHVLADERFSSQDSSNKLILQRHCQIFETKKGAFIVKRTSSSNNDNKESFRVFLTIEEVMTDLDPKKNEETGALKKLNQYLGIIKLREV